MSPTRPAIPNALRIVAGSLTTVWTLSGCIHAQEAPTAPRTHFEIVDRDFAVRYGGDSLTIDWRGVPASGEQLVPLGTGTRLLLDDERRGRLLVSVRDGELSYVDRAYAGEEAFARAVRAARVGYAPADRAPEPAEGERDADAGQVVASARHGFVVDLGRGVRFFFEDGEPVAARGDERFAVSGARGRYRVYGPDFEAGVALMRSGEVYHYLRDTARR